MAKTHEWTQLGKDKVMSSGLTSTQATALGMYEVPSAMTLHPSFEARPALVIPYFNADGKPLPQRAGWDQFYRVRYLDKQKFDFKQAAGAKPGPKYMQPPETMVRAYFPKTVDWSKVVKNQNERILITEGELKAAAAALAGFTTIGLGGVWNFRAMKEGVLWLPELEAIKWVQRRVFVCFDSDYLEKDNICKAINALCEELQQRGAFVKLVTLPQSGDNKVGLDDYLLENPPEELEGLLAQAVTLGLTGTLWGMNKEIVYVENPGLIVAGPRTDKLSVEAFKNHSKWATQSAVDTRVNNNGSIIYEKSNAAQVWIKWPHRERVNRMTYAPGEDKFTSDDELNLWPGWGLTPKKGSIDPWIKLTKFLFSECEPGILEYFYDWCAYPLQNPGAKMFVGVVIHGVAQGTGKTLIGYTLARIYGENFKEITDDDLEETYWAENKQFILGDEVSGKDNRQYMNTLKRLITKSTTSINIKFVPQYELPNRMNFLFTSQHSDSFFLEDKDRRFMVVEVKSDPLPIEFYTEYDKWYKGDGAAALFHWLLERKIDKKFNAMAAAPATSAKARMILATKGDLAVWVHDLKEYPNQVLRTGGMRFTRDLFTSKELLSLYERDHPNSKVTAVGLGRALTNGGFFQAAGGQPLKNPDGRADRYFVVRNLHEWQKCKDRRTMENNIKMQPVKDGK